jgi:hypothetical protein
MISQAASMPIRDELHIGEFLPAAVARGYPSVSELFARYNDSRPFFPRLAMFAMAAMIGWDPRVEMLFSWGLMLLTVLSIGRICRRTLTSRVRDWSAAYAGVWVFAVVQYANMLWGAQFILFVPMACLTVALGIMRSRAPVWSRLTGSMIAAVVSTFSMANGLLAWPLLLPAIGWMPRASRTTRTWAAAAWIAAAAVTMAVFFAGHSRHVAPGAESRIVSRPDRLFEFFLIFLGNGPRVFVELPGTRGVTAVVGGAALGVFGIAGAMLLANAGRSPRSTALFLRALPWIVIGGYALLSGLAITAGRHQLGIDAARSERYPTFALPVFVTLPALIDLAVRSGRLGRRADRQNRFTGRLPLVVAVVSTTLLMLGSITCWSADFTSIRGWIGALRRARINAIFIEVAPNAAELPMLHDSLAYAQEQFARADAERLLAWPLLKSAIVEEESSFRDAGGRPHPQVVGCIERVSREAATITMSGFATAPSSRLRPADAVAIAVVEADGRRRLVTHTALTAVRRPDIADRLPGWNTDCGWDFTFDARLVPPQAVVTALAFDERTRSFAELEGRQIAP